MKKLQMGLVGAGVVTMVGLLAGCGSSNSSTSASSSNNNNNTVSASSSKSGTPIVMKIGDTSSASSIPGETADKFAALVNKYSNGDIKAKVYHNGQLGPFQQEATELKTNAINAIFIQPDALGTQVKLAQVDAWPFMFQTPEQMVKAWQGPGGQKVIQEIQKESGYLLAAPTWNTPRNIFLNKSVSSLKDAKGLKLRVPGEDVYLDQMKLLGLTAVGMNIGDVYTGMQSNVVNGMEATLPDASNYSLQDVTKTVITDGHVIAPKMWLFWGKWIDSLSPADKSAVMKAATDASAFYSKQAQDQSKKITQEFKDKGVTFVSPGLTFQQMQAMTAPLQKQLPDLYKWAKILENGAQ